MLGLFDKWDLSIIFVCLSAGLLNAFMLSPKTTIDHDVSTRIELADLERQLARWQNEIDDILADDAKRPGVVSQAREMSDGLIAKSGLLNQ